jgi:hypothetical protein
VIWEIDGFYVGNMMPPGVCFNTEYFLTHIIDPLLAKVFGREGKAMYFD